MEAKLMRNIDWYVGVPLCIVLGLLARIAKRFRSKEEKPVRNILLIKFFGIGSIVLSTPMIAALRDAYPNAKIHFLTFSSNREILELLDCVDKTYFIEKKSLFSFILSTLKNIWVLRKIGIDLVFDLEFFAKFPLVIAFLSGAKKKAGFYLTLEPWRKAPLDCHGYFNHYYHVKDIFLSLVYLVKKKDPYYLEFKAYADRYKISRVSPKSQLLHSVKEKLQRHGWRPGQDIVVVNVNAGKELAPTLKRWVPENF